MGGKSELSANFEEGVVKLDGEVTTKNNGGFVRLAHRPDEINKKLRASNSKLKVTMKLMKFTSH